MALTNPAYVDNLVGSGKVDKAAIFSRAGDSVWCTTSDFSVAPAEVLELAKGFDDPSPLQAGGLHIAGQKYFLLRADDRSIYGKHEQSGIIAVRTGQAIIVGHYPDGIQPGEATKVVEALGDYLIKANY